MSITAPFPYLMHEDLRRRNPMAVFQLEFGKKFFIFKGLRILNTVETLSKQIHREINKPKDDSILFNVIAYIRKSRVTTMTVTILAETDNPASLLWHEYEMLQASKNNPDCLNTRFINNEYFPNWIPQSAINEFNQRLQGVKKPDHEKNFKRFLKRHIEDEGIVDKIIKYVSEHYRAGGSRKKRNEGHKNISKKRTD